MQGNERGQCETLQGKKGEERLLMVGHEKVPRGLESVE